jgi:hypothetical protein
MLGDTALESIYRQYEQIRSVAVHGSEAPSGDDVLALQWFRAAFTL